MYNIGDKVVYPMHGAGIIHKIEEREILGELKDYYVLKLPFGDMKVMVPVNSSEEVGLRDIIPREKLEGVFEVLKSPSTPMASNWNRRHRENMEKLRSGDILQVAGVVRNLMRVEKEKKLSTGEKKLLTNAKQILLSEMILAGDYSQEEAEEAVNSAI